MPPDQPFIHTANDPSVSEFSTQDAANKLDVVMATDAELASGLAGKANLSHTHDDRYYQKTESDSALSGKANSSHNHDDRYYTETETDAALAGKASTSHNHDSRYYQKGEVDSALTGKSDTSHIHDERYYRESEVDAALAGKANTSHTHTLATASADGFMSKEAFAKLDSITPAKFATGTASLSAILIAGGSVDLTVPISPTLPDTNYFPVPQFTNLPVVVLGNMALSIKTKNVSSVVVTVKNNALVSLAAGTTVEVSAIKNLS